MRYQAALLPDVGALAVKLACRQSNMIGKSYYRPAPTKKGGPFDGPPFENLADAKIIRQRSQR